jgi:hypothetical protein
MKRVSLIVLALVLAVTSFAAEKSEKKQKQPGTVVDAGTFGVFIGGRRVATERFQIMQHSDGITLKAEITAVADEKSKVAQTAELEMTAAGDLVRYVWREPGPTRSEATVEQSAEFLVQHIFQGEKSSDVPYLLPHNTPILDDYFFSQRELLAWRYLASGCAPKDGVVECRLTPTTYGVLIPQQHLSMVVAVEAAATREKLSINGAERQLTRLNLKGENYDWSLWLDDKNKMVRILVPAENTEIIRD